LVTVVAGLAQICIDVSVSAVGTRRRRAKLIAAGLPLGTAAIVRLALVYIGTFVLRTVTICARKEASITTTTIVVITFVYICADRLSTHLIVAADEAGITAPPVIIGTFVYVVTGTSIGVKYVARVTRAPIACLFVLTHLGTVATIHLAFIDIGTGSTIFV